MSDSDDFITEFKCAISSKPHYLINPIPLKCGHHVCNTCVSIQANNQIKCLICETVTEPDLNNKQTLKNIQIVFQNNFEKLFLSMKKLYEKALESLNGL